MDPNPVILEISSDEEGGWVERNNDSSEWFSELLKKVEKEREGSDDVVIVGEVFNSSGTKNPTSKDDFDDDCVILDGDPENPVPVVNDKENGSDELLIVGEKGQLACRDYPHPRHLCAKFPFGSTPHERYCDLCHCYVCDLHAPCIHWGTGVSSTDHCHSTDKNEIWSVLRENFKQGKIATLPVQKFPGTTLSSTPGLPNPAPAPTLPELLNCGPVPVHTVFKPSPRLRACSSSTSFGIPNIINIRRQQSGLTHGRHRFSPQPMPATNSSIRRDRGGGIDTLVPQFVFPTAKFKRVGCVGGGLTMNLSAYGSSNDNNHVYVSQPPRNCHQPTVPMDNLHLGWQDLLAGLDLDINTCQSSLQPNTSSSSFTHPQSYTMTSQPQVYSQPLPQQEFNQTLYPNGNSIINTSNDFSWRNSTGQCLQPSPAEDSQLQNVQPTYGPIPVTESNCQYPVSTNPGSFDLEFESFITSLENELDPVTAKDSVPLEADFVSPQPTLLDPNMLLYDFENSVG